MTDLVYLVEEVCAGLEIFYSSRQGGQYWKAAYLLCDDYTELTAKYFLLDRDPNWPDKNANGHYKSYHAVMADVVTSIEQDSAFESSAVQSLTHSMKTRRTRRNGFFHSTSLLDLNVSYRTCIESFRDLIDFGRYLLGERWDQEIRLARNMETLVLMLRVEDRCLREPKKQSELNELLSSWPRNRSTGKSKGVQVAVYPEDLHLRLAVINGAADLRDALTRLLEN